ncbi:glycine cleavage system protein R [Rhodopila sp.]|uniref:glycine cleavage system protein R n=1 Tax=Rhodopila sp. TaxID=2480087 RepID=UPI003D0F4273
MAGARPPAFGTGMATAEQVWLDESKLDGSNASERKVAQPTQDWQIMASLILTVIGPDRPGLVRSLAHAVAAHGGSWLESRMARLAGQFAGIVLVEAPQALLADLRALESEGLQIVAQNAAGVGPVNQDGAGERLALEVVGNDRPGIVRDIARILADNAVNIEELTTNVASGSFSGGTLFRATALLRAPNPRAVEAVRASLERLGHELIVDIQPAENVPGSNLSSA